MMTVFHIISRFDIGGAERVALNISKSNSKNIEYHLIEIAAADSNYTVQFIKEAEDNGVTVHRAKVRNTKLAMLAFPSRLAALIRKFHPSIIHTHTEVPDLSLYLYSIYSGNLLKNIGIVRTIHNNQLWNRWKWIGKKVEKFMQNKASNIAISESTRDSYSDEYGSVCQIIHNGVETTTQKLFPELVKGKLNILFAGRMEYQKGIDSLIDVVSYYGNDTRFVFHIIGSGSEKDKVTQALSKFDNVAFKDRIPLLASQLGSFDYLFMPSLFEGLALTPMEASIAGTPTIINNAKGLSETLPQDWPLKVNNNDLREYIKIFENLSNLDYKLLQSLAEKYTIQRFSLSEMQNNYEKLYYEICRQATNT